MAKNISENINIPSHPQGSIFKFDRLGLGDKEVIKDFNTYKNWGRFHMLAEQPEGGQVDPIGTKALFNNFYGVYDNTMMQLNNNAPLLDTPETRNYQREHAKCTIKELIRASAENEMGRAVYSYSDFMYCKHLGEIPNNHLITLRRFPTPCGDHINFTLPNSSIEKEFNDHAPDLARMVTWMGVDGNEINNILKYNYKMKWKTLTAEIQEAQGQGDMAQGPLGALFSAADSNYSKQVQQGISGGQVGTYANQLFAKVPGGSMLTSGISGMPYQNAPWLGNYDKNRVYGPLDVIMSTNIRDQGLEFEQNITLVFNYELRSYDGINGKAAMLDLLSNILACTYVTGKFWGGGYKTIGAHQSNLFANLPIFKDSAGGKINSISDLQDSLMDSMTNISDKIASNGGLKETAKKLLNNMGQMLMGGMLNKLGRPAKQALSSLLSPAPTGPWHLTIGNPKAPILSMGNMILKSSEIEHYGPLGIDDFPTGIKVTITLEHGKARDISGIEQMYLMGDNRIYTPMGDKIETVYENAIDYKPIRKKGSIETQPTAMDETTTMDSKQINKYIKFFGTSNINTITIASKEAAFGSVNPSKKSSKK